jgi:CheY-like chemotaxis protein
VVDRTDAGEAQQRPPAVLVVDDNSSNRLAREAVLADLGYRTVMADSGEEALRRLEEHRVVLILMDAHMPVLDGYGTTARIRRDARWRDIPVMFLTAVHDDPEHMRQGYALGAVDYMGKPFDPHVLRAKVQALVKLYTLGERAESARREQLERLGA